MWILGTKYPLAYMSLIRKKQNKIQNNFKKKKIGATHRQVIYKFPEL